MKVERQFDERRKLAGKLADDFPASPVPERVTNRASLEAKQIESFFSGRKWRDVSLAVLRNDYVGDASACLGFMLPSAFTYYLPAFMTICLVEGWDADVCINTTLWRLTLNYSETQDVRWFNERFASLNAKQNADISEFLHSMAEFLGEDSGGDATRALNSYWHRY